MRFSKTISIASRWILVNAIGWAASIALAGLLSEATAHISGFNTDRFVGIAILISLGVWLGAAQWLVMKRLIPQPNRWAVATIIGFVLCAVIMTLVNFLRLGGIGILNNLLWMAVMGSVVGVSQWWILRKHYSKAGWWILATAAGFFCFMVFVVNPVSTLGGFIVRGGIMGGFSAIAPGVVLDWLARRTSSGVSSEEALPDKNSG